MKSLFLSLAACAALFLPATARAQVPMLISYQGRVVVGGTNFDGSGQFKFALVNAAERGAYLHPELYGQLEARRIGLMRPEEKPAAAVPEK